MRNSQPPTRLRPRAASRCPHRSPSTLPLPLQLFRLVFRFSFLFLSFVIWFSVLARDVASIDNQRGAGRKFRIIGSEIKNCGGDFFADTDSLDRSDRRDLVAILVPGEAIEHLGSNHAGSNRIDANVLFGEL